MKNKIKMKNKKWMEPANKIRGSRRKGTETFSLRFLTILLTLALVLMPVVAQAAATQGTNINCLGSLGAGGPIYAADGSTALSVGNVIQIIDTTNTTAKAPKSDGSLSDANEKVLATIKVGEGTATAGTFYKFLAASAHEESHYLYIRAWNDSSVASATKYGDSTLKLISHGSPPSPLNWDVASFATNKDKGGSNDSKPSISGILPSPAAIGQTIVISGSKFGTYGSSSAVRFSTSTLGKPTAWSDTSITIAVPAGIPTGETNVTVVNSAGEGSSKMIVTGLTKTDGSIYIDDYEGGCVGKWAIGTASIESGYYAFGTGITPTSNDISNKGPVAEAKYADAKGMKVQYSYTSGWGGGWGGTLANILDISNAQKISFQINWDGSSNSMKLGFKDSDGTVVSATISNAILAASSGYKKITKNISDFVYDKEGSTTGSDTTFDWAKVTDYSINYNTKSTSTNYQYLDNLIAFSGGGGTDPVVTGEVQITSIDPAAAPAGTTIKITGKGYGLTQGQSTLLFENRLTNASYQAVEILSWSETEIIAIVPKLAKVGDYNTKVIKVAISQGSITAQESNPAAFEVTAAASTGLINAYPNPFNPLGAAGSNTITIAYNKGAATNVGIYIYDMTARLMKKETVTTSQTTWDGYDDWSILVGDGAYIVRVIDEDSKRLIAKGKILVIKQ